MAHPSCQLAANSPKKTPQSTPSKSAPVAATDPAGNDANTGEVPADGTGSGVAASAAGAVQMLAQSIQIRRCPVMQRFGCLRVYRLSSLLLSMHC